MSREWITPRILAEWCGLHERTVRRKLGAQLLPVRARFESGRWRIRRDDARAYVEMRTPEPA